MLLVCTECGMTIALRLLPIAYLSDLCCVVLRHAHLDVHAVVCVALEDEAVVHEVLVVGLPVVLEQLLPRLEGPRGVRDGVLTLRTQTPQYERTPIPAPRSIHNRGDTERVRRPRHACTLNPHRLIQIRGVDTPRIRRSLHTVDQVK
jgi:hypothetical protein